LLHDIGKSKAAWQEYLTKKMAGEDAAIVDHKGAAAAYASKYTNGMYLSMILAGHHGGMPNLVNRPAAPSKDASLKGSLANPQGDWQLGRIEVESVMQEFLDDVNAHGNYLWDEGNQLETFAQLLFLYSCLVDADSIDTGTHFMNRVEVEQESLADLLLRLDAFQATTEYGLASVKVQSLRSKVLADCRDAASLPRGFFTLNAPTGLGKTIAGMEFALRHAISNGMDGVRSIAPYRSIIDQTTAVYKSIFGDMNVLGHHSTAEFWSNEYTNSKQWKEDKIQRQTAENWDCPIVVSTAVQFFESLFCSRPGAARKIHNLVNTVIILDEVQTMPTNLLYPLFQMLKILVDVYHCSIVFTTATMPPVSQLLQTVHEDSSWNVELLDHDIHCTEIVSDPCTLFTDSRRTEIVMGNLDLNTIAHGHQSLTIFNTRKQAIQAYQMLRMLTGNSGGTSLGFGLYFLSTHECSRHRSSIISEIKERLQSGLRCIVVSTQLVEAGVDFDFPVLYRAMAPLDSILQSAGRCNRHGLMDSAICTVFESEGYPDSSYRRKAEITRELLVMEGRAAYSLETLYEYNSRVYAQFNLDKDEIRSAMTTFAFGYLRENFSLIDSVQVSLIVEHGTEEERSRCQNAIHQIQDAIAADETVPQKAIRSIQPFVVSVYRNELERLGVSEDDHLTMDYYVFDGEYSEATGVAEVGTEFVHGE
jgi:CRISPR-associated endonuclease/helicase Cas3